MSRNMVSTAASYYKATLTVTTGLSAPFNNLAIIYKQQVVNFFLSYFGYFIYVLDNYQKHNKGVVPI